MSSCFRGCISAAWRCLILLSVPVLFSCGAKQDAEVEVREVLEKWARPDAINTASKPTENLVQLFSGQENITILLDWAIQHPARFIPLLDYLKDPELLERFASLAVARGKSFIMMELLAQQSSNEATLLLAAIKKIEHFDARVKVPVRDRHNNPVLQRVVAFEGENDRHAWRGGALVVAENECRIALATAGHNILGEQGELRTSLNQLRLHLKNEKLPVSEVFPLSSPVQSAEDWIILMVDKPRCSKGINYPDMALATDQSIPKTGLEINLYCFYQSGAELIPSLHREQCQIYPTRSGVLSHFTEYADGKLGIHTCQSETGSSGCPVFYIEDGTAYFMAMQIERDRPTGAGIARMVRDDFAQAVSLVQKRLAK